MNALMMIFIQIMFILIFFIILIDVKNKKNISLAVNAIGVFIIIMILKVLLFIYYMLQGKTNCDMMNEWLNC
tara:strand:+ start:109 stop:324 length:216 start_codon:yes stop_codon:yes gene_type:complete